MQEGELALDGGEMRHGAEVHRLLGAVGGEKRETGLAAGHDVAVVAENRERVGRNAAGGDVEHARELLGGDLIHVRDHEQESLRGRKGARQGARDEGAMHRSGGAGFRLHFQNLHGPDQKCSSARLPTIYRHIPPLWRMG